jgi:Flp pilus assembly protein TadG
METLRSRRARSRRGSSMIEFAFLMPWIIFLFVGAFDWGFYAHALISTENAARVAVVYAANLGGGSISKTTACNLVLNELSIAANVAGQTTCVWGTSVSSSSPVGVTETCTTIDSVSSVQVAVTYQTLQLIPIPGLLEGKATIYRTATLPMNPNDNGGSCPTPS